MSNPNKNILPNLIAQAAEPLPDIDDPNFGSFFDRFGDSKVVLLGESSHGTSEFYRARTAITKHLIQHHGFSFVAVEADWPDASAINNYVRHSKKSSRPLEVFQRFPTWMWRNTDAAELIDWMRDHNERLPESQRAGFYGLDMYSMGSSISAVLQYLQKVDPESAEVARHRYGCLMPWMKKPSDYGLAVITGRYRSCEPGVVRECRELLEKAMEYAEDGDEDFLNAAQNARLVVASEQYYRTMYHGDAESWNLRDTHMFETLNHLLQAHGPNSKAIVWAHNSHIGDARFTDMGTERDELNIGQLCRERFGKQSSLIGFGTHTGSVAAADDWDGDMKIKKVLPSLPNSIERACHDSGVPSFLLDLDPKKHKELVRELKKSRIERFIGVIYRPDTELHSHYSGVVLPGQFDAYVWFDQTTAVTPLGPQHARLGAPETYPFGL